MEKEMHPNAGVTQTRAAQPSSADRFMEPWSQTGQKQLKNRLLLVATVQVPHPTGRPLSREQHFSKMSQQRFDSRAMCWSKTHLRRALVSGSQAGASTPHPDTSLGLE